jgi:hypothetical protein
MQITSIVLFVNIIHAYPILFIIYFRFAHTTWDIITFFFPPTCNNDNNKAWDILYSNDKWYIFCILNISYSLSVCECFLHPPKCILSYSKRSNCVKKRRGGNPSFFVLLIRICTLWWMWIKINCAKDDGGSCSSSRSEGKTDATQWEVVCGVILFVVCILCENVIYETLRWIYDEETATHLFQCNNTNKNLLQCYLTSMMAKKFHTRKNAC